MTDKKLLQGIALILFGILLCLSGGEINYYLMQDIDYFPFALVGTIVGVVGLVKVFYEKKEDTEKTEETKKSEK